MSEFAFTPAVREHTPMIMALAGASGTGKTFTALELVMGLLDQPMSRDSNGKALLIDTEGRRGLHYADLMLPNGEPRFRFDHCDFQAPYSPERFLAVLKQAEAIHYGAIIVDSASDEYVGEGGLVDMADAEYKRMKNPNSAAAWARPKAAHKQVIRWLRQSRCHLIFCIRAEEKVKLEPVEEYGKKVTKIVPIGWQPICEKNFMYDMTTSFMFHPDHPGVPHPIKLQEQHRRFFPAGEPITRDAGRLLGEWWEVSERLVANARKAAGKGMAALEKFCNDLTRQQRASIKMLVLEELQPIARAVNENMKCDDQITE
jgi:ABC-type dipeptide/oligopeptide/nickel transport system ATPase component